MSAITLQATYPAPKEAVWAYLVNNELLGKWCMPAKDFALAPGQCFTFESQPSPFWDGRFYNTVIDFEAHERLSYQCVAKKPALDTTVTWTLTEQDGKTTLALEHSGFQGSDWLTKKMLAGGWKKMMCTNLAEIMEETR